MKKFLSIILVLIFVFLSSTACSVNDEVNGSQSDNLQNGSINDNSTQSGSGSDDTSSPIEVDFASTDEEMFTERDQKIEYNEKESVLIRLDGSVASSSSNSVKISGSKIVISEEATYIISGKLDDGMIVVNAPDTAKIGLVLNGVNITSSTSAAIYILEANKVFLTLADGTDNILANGGTFTAVDDNNIDSVIFSRQDLTINGEGSLRVTSPIGHGIVSKDDLVITGGTIEVNAASHGLDANDSIRITGASIKADVGKDGIHAENSDDPSLGFVYISGGSFDIAAEGDGISSGAYIQIENGTFDITAGGGSVNGTKESSDSWGGFMGGGGKGGRPGGAWDFSGSSSDASSSTTDNGTSMKGIKSNNDMLITSGTFKIDSADDSLHSNTSLTINGGVFDISSGDDAIHAEETLSITSGTIGITESYEGLEALDIAVLGGEIELVARDDGLNAAGGMDSSGMMGGRDAMFPGKGGPGGFGGMSSSSNGSVTISGGSLYIKSSGDGIDANGSITISGGNTIIVGPTQGDTATLDYDKSCIISGGTFIGTGAAGMAQTFSAAEQGVIALSVGNQNAGTLITLMDKKGNTIISHTPELSYQVVILSSYEMVSGETYTVKVGDLSGDFTAN